LRFNVEVRAPLQHALPMQVICEVPREAINRDAHQVNVPLWKCWGANADL
jgi:hypothetical protein